MQALSALACCVGCGFSGVASLVFEPFYPTYYNAECRGNPSAYGTSPKTVEEFARPCKKHRKRQGQTRRSAPYGCGKKAINNTKNVGAGGKYFMSVSFRTYVRNLFIDFEILWQSLLIATYTAQTSPALRVTNCCKHCRTKVSSLRSVGMTLLSNIYIINEN